MISVTLGNRYTMNVRTSVVLDTSLLSMVKDTSVVKISSFDICMKEWILLSEKTIFLSFWNRFNLPRLE